MVVIDADPGKGFQTMLFTGLTKEQIVRDWPLAYMRHLRHKLDFELGNFMLDLFYYTHRESYAQAVHKMLNSEREWSKYTGKNAAIRGYNDDLVSAPTGDTSFDSRLIEAANAVLLDESDNHPAIALVRKHSERFLNVPGLVYLRMFKDGAVELDNRNTGILNAACRATHDNHYLEYAIGLAYNRFQDSYYIRDGREMGCRGSWRGRNGVAMHNVIAPMM